MCECIAQLYPPDSYLDRLNPVSFTGSPAKQIRESSCPDLRDRDHVIRPNHYLKAIMNKNGTLLCQKIRWGWSPVWSMGTRPPLTHLPLEIVMRSKVFKRIRNGGRALVAVDGWFDSASDGGSVTAACRFIYTKTRSEEPVYLAALAQTGDSASGCCGLVLITQGGGGSSGPLQLLALDGKRAVRWLDHSLDWPQAQTLVSDNSNTEQAFERIAVRQSAIATHR